MGDAKNVMDQITASIVNKDWEAAAGLYAENAVASTPDQGEISGREAIVAYLRSFGEAFPDLQWESLASNDCGETAVDEGFIVGTHTQPMSLPSGESVAATNKKIRVRECDILTVKDGVATSHRFYFDQMELVRQLGLLPETTD